MRFPPPDFQTAYKVPDIDVWPVQSSNGTKDAVILFIALSITTWLDDQLKGVDGTWRLFAVA